MKSLVYRRSLAVVAVGLGVCGGPAAETWAQEGTAQPQPSDEAANRSKGEAALAEARKAMADHRWQDAIAAWNRALVFLPGNKEALDQLQVAQAEMNVGSTISEEEKARSVRLGQARTEFRASMGQSEQLLSQGDYGAAESGVITAQVRLRQNRDLFSQREYEDFNRQAEQLLARIDQARERHELFEREKSDAETAELQREAQARELQQRQNLVNENMIRARQLQMELKYDDALQVIDEVLFIDPINPAALLVRDVIRTNMLYRNYADVIKQKEYGYAWLGLGSQEGMIPPQPNISGPGDKSLQGVIQYPEDWAQLSLRRTHEAALSESPATQKVNAVLNQKTFPADFRGNTLEQITGYLGKLTRQNFYADWKALELIGVHRDDPVTLQLNDVSVATVLDRVMEQLGDEGDRPQWAVQDGIVTISSDEALRKHTVTVLYDIRDLLFEVPYFGNAPDHDLAVALSQGNGSGRSAADRGRDRFGSVGGREREDRGGAVFGEGDDQPPRVKREEIVDQIVAVIQDNVDPQGWRDLGGDTGTLQELNGNLIITNTVRNHRSIEGLLAQLREIRALQINVESRFLEVSTDWFEQIGVDLDLYFNTNKALRRQQQTVDPLAHLSDLFDPNTGQLIDPFRFGQIFDPLTGDLVADRVPWGAIFGVPGQAPPGSVGFPDIQDIDYQIGPVGQPLRATDGWAPIGMVQDSLGLVNSVADLTGFGEAVAAATPALTLGLQYLDDIQVDLLVEATQADRRAVVLTAPRLTFFNGQRAWVAVAQQVAFVSALVPITGDAAGAFQPIPGVVSEGVVLDVEGVISADRRYVTMTVIVSQSNIINIREFQVEGAVGGTGTIAGNAVFSATLELPEVRVSLVNTTVSVPDKGTVLLGGTRLVNEVEVEAGVPILSKIPFINRFFTNRLTSKSEKTLLILIRPEIIIQQENEDLLFPGLSDTLGGAASYQ